MSGVGPMQVFTMNEAGRAATKQQILDGHNMLGGGPTACTLPAQRAVGPWWITGEFGEFHGYVMVNEWFIDDTVS